MHVDIHTLFEILLEGTAARPRAAIGLSLAQSPCLGDFLADLDPGLSLDWSNESFQGRRRLRELVVERAGLAGVCDPDDVVITAGTAEANFLALTQLVAPGDEIIAEVPGWPQPFVLGAAIGARLVPIVRREAQAWRLDLDELASKVTARTRLIFLANPSNPTGQVLDAEELRAVAALADQVGAYVLCDEVYAGLEWADPRAPALAGLYKRGISTGSVSKTLGLQGLRTGWLISRDAHVRREAIILRENTSEIMNVLGEAVAEIALREPRYAAALDRARTDGLRHLAVVDTFVASRPELSWHRPRAGLVGLARLHLSMDGDELTRRLLASPYRTLCISGSAFDCPQHIRLGCGGGNQASIDDGLAQLGALLDQVR